MKVKLIGISLLAAAGIMSAGVAQADEALAKAKNCLACHNVDKKVVGPSYKDVAKKLKDEQRKPSSASGSYHWGTVSFGKGGEKEEVWEDELGWFQGDMTDECASKDKYLKLRELQQGG